MDMKSHEKSTETTRSKFQIHFLIMFHRKSPTWKSAGKVLEPRSGEKPQEGARVSWMYLDVFGFFVPTIG
jgi:hypothetical protein